MARVPDPNSKPGPVEALGHEWLSRSSIWGSHQDQGGVNLLGLSKDALLRQGRLNSLGQLLELPLVHILPKGRGPKLACRL